jgi:hypothetical protein
MSRTTTETRIYCPACGEVRSSQVKPTRPTVVVLPHDRMQSGGVKQRCPGGVADTTADAAP